MSGDELELRVAWQRHVGTGPVADDWFESVVRRHRAPGRHYHDLRHVTWVVRHVDELLARPDVDVDDGDAVVAAGFFHDAVYDPTRSDNEEASARLSVAALGEIGWDAERCERVAALIRATAGHDLTDAAVGPDTQVLLAADLAVLASEPARYDDYARAVRREYAHVGDADWRAGRTAVLRELLGREHLFAPSLRLDRWEHRARANLTAELAGLGG